MRNALFLRSLMAEFPAYTLSSLLGEDAHGLLGLRALSDPKLGEDDDADAE